MTTIVANHLRLVEATERIADLLERSLEQKERELDQRQRHHEEAILVQSGKFREEAGPILSAAAQGCQDRREAGKAELPPFVKSVPLPDDHSGTSEPWALRILAEEIWFQERGDWPDEQDAEMFNDPERVKRFLTARTVARCWDSAEAALAALKEGKQA